MGPPKTPRSRRHVYLDPQTLAVLREHRKRQREERLGHATVGVTLDLYSHVVPSIARDAANLVASHIFDVGATDV